MSALLVSSAVSDELRGRRSHLQNLGVGVIYSVLPVSPFRRPTACVHANTSPPESFDEEAKTLGLIAMSYPDEELASAHRLTLAVTELAASLQSAADAVAEEARAIRGLFGYAELRLLPRFAKRPPSMLRAMELAKKWRFRKGLPDCVELHKLVDYQERLAAQLLLLQPQAREGGNPGGKAPGGGWSPWKGVSPWERVTEEKGVGERCPGGGWRGSGPELGGAGNGNGGGGA